MMTKFLFLAAIAAVAATPAHAASGNTSTAAGSAVAVVVTPIVLTHVTGTALNFGAFTTGSGGSVVVTPGGAGSPTGGVSFVPGSVETADQFAVVSETARSFSISTTSGAVTLAGGTTTMAFTTTPSAGSATTNVIGTATFSVGGTLTVAGTEGNGAYSGTYNATITYN